MVKFKLILCLIFFGFFVYGQGKGIVERIEKQNLVNKVRMLNTYVKNKELINSDKYYFEPIERWLYFDGIEVNNLNFHVLGSVFHTYHPSSIYTSGKGITGIEYVNNQVHSIESKVAYRYYISCEYQVRIFDVQTDLASNVTLYHYLMSNEEDYDSEFKLLGKDFQFDIEGNFYYGVTELMGMKNKVKVHPIKWKANTPDNILLRGFRIELFE